MTRDTIFVESYDLVLVHGVTHQEVVEDCYLTDRGAAKAGSKLVADLANPWEVGEVRAHSTGTVVAFIDYDGTVSVPDAV